MLEAKMQPTPEAIQQWIRGMEKSIISKMDYKKFAPVVAAEVARIFVTQGYGSWAPLSENYAIRKAKIRPFSTILRLTDEYFQAATQVGHSKNIMRANNKSLIYGVGGFSPNYPLFHEIGTAKMPARPVWDKLAKSQPLQEKIVLAFRKQLHKNLEKEGARFFG